MSEPIDKFSVKYFKAFSVRKHTYTDHMLESHELDALWSHYGL
jgi:hypothetical protein